MNKNGLDFSQKVLIGVGSFVILVIICAFYLMFKLSDLSSLGEIIIGSFAVLTAVTGFVIWKEKNESLIQLMKENPELVDEVREEIHEELEENIDKDF